MTKQEIIDRLVEEENYLRGRFAEASEGENKYSPDGYHCGLQEAYHVASVRLLNLIDDLREASKWTLKIRKNTRSE